MVTELPSQIYYIKNQTINTGAVFSSKRCYQKTKCVPFNYAYSKNCSFAIVFINIICQSWLFFKTLVLQTFGQTLASLSLHLPFCKIICLPFLTCITNITHVGQLHISQGHHLVKTWKSGEVEDTVDQISAV